LQTDDLDNNEDMNLLFTTIQVQKSFYNKLERKTSKKISHKDYNCLISTNETTYDNVVTMDLTSKYFIFKIIIEINIIIIL